MKDNLPTQIEELSGLYDEKIEKLLKLIENQKRQIEVLGFGNGEVSARIAIVNEKIIKSMVKLDQKIEKVAETLPGSSRLIEKSDEVFSLIDIARANHEIIQKKMEQCLNDVKKELNMVQVKRQLARHLHGTKLWTATHC